MKTEIRNVKAMGVYVLERLLGWDSNFLESLLVAWQLHCDKTLQSHCTQGVHVLLNDQNDDCSMFDIGIYVCGQNFTKP